MPRYFRIMCNSIWTMCVALHVVVAQMDRKEINEWKLEEEWREEGEIDPEDLPEHERARKPITPDDFKKVTLLYGNFY